jgi:hypothetical protein
MPESMEEYNETKQLRLQYPLDLTKDQQKEILDQLPANPVRADMVGLEPRICTEPDVSKSIIIWDGEELTWKNRKTDEVISQFSSNTAYKSVAIN